MARGIYDYDTLTPNLKRLLPVVDAAVDLVFDQYAPRMESYMRSHASWTDRTGNARAGLFAQHDGQRMVKHSLTLYGAMPYSIWLELRWSGKYVIIGPTMLHESPNMAADLAAAINRAIGGMA